MLYTHQKQKKHKTWQDGVLKVNDDGTRAALHAAVGSTAASFLEAILIRNGVREQIRSLLFLLDQISREYLI